MMKNWQQKPMAGPKGLLNTALILPHSSCVPMKKVTVTMKIPMMTVKI